MSTTQMNRPDAAPERPGPLSPHRTDLVAFVFGLAFLAIGLISLGNQLDWFGGDDGNFGGITLAVIGSIGVLAVLAAGLRRSRAPQIEPAPLEPAQPETVTPDDAIDS
jgi:hypothetical protein